MKNQPSWYVVYTYPNIEKKIYNELVKRKITAFFPTKQVVRQWSDRKKKLDVPLFPNYIFVNILPGEAWTVLMISGIVRFVTFDGAPAIVKDTDIDLVKRLTAQVAIVHNEASYVKGELMQVKAGPLAGLVGSVIQTKGTTKLYLSLETVHQIVSVEIETDLLERVSLSKIA